MPNMVPLLLFDLDNTLVNRNKAFQGWAEGFLASRSLPPGDLDWFTTLDCGGYLERRVLLRAASERYGLTERMEVLLDDYRDTVTGLIECPASHYDALRAARADGWTLGIVSNGATGQQLAKIERTGLAELVDGWVISEEADCAKPDPRIFRIAAFRCGVDTTKEWTADAWMIGDHPPADIAGARVAGLRSVWLNHGRAWPETGYTPTFTASGIPEAIALAGAARAADSATRTTAGLAAFAGPAASPAGPTVAVAGLAASVAGLAASAGPAGATPPSPRPALLPAH